MKVLSTSGSRLLFLDWVSQFWQGCFQTKWKLHYYIPKHSFVISKILHGSVGQRESVQE